jgi:hypothetical protein
LHKIKNFTRRVYLQIYKNEAKRIDANKKEKYLPMKGVRLGKKDEEGHCKGVNWLEHPVC